MRSSSRDRSIVILVVAAFAVGCGSPSPAREQQSGAAALECSTAGLSDSKDAAVFGEMRRAAEAAPAYRALARLASPRSCRGSAASGEVSIEYSFSNDDTFTFVRNPAIEYSQQDVTLAAPRDLAATELLRQIERESFSPDGCGVDWEDATPLSSSEGGGRETAYYGETCNCQARVRTDASGKTIGFVFRSAC